MGFDERKSMKSMTKLFWPIVHPLYPFSFCYAQSRKNKSFSKEVKVNEFSITLC